MIVTIYQNGQPLICQRGENLFKDQALGETSSEFERESAKLNTSVGKRNKVQRGRETSAMIWSLGVNQHQKGSFQEEF